MQTVPEEAGGCWTRSRRLGPGPRDRKEVEGRRGEVLKSIEGQ